MELSSFSSSREFAFTLADFNKICAMIYNYAGIVLSASKQDMVYSRLVRRLRETGLKSFSDYLSFVEKRETGEWEKFVNSLTTNLTSFFREPHHFPILAEHLKQIQKKSVIKVWCSAASTGEEPYSIAMTVAETFGGFNTPVSIIATDLDTNVLAIAAKGVYAKDRVDKLSPERLSRFFTTSEERHETLYTVKPELRRMVSFQKLNLLAQNWFVRSPLDVLFCRNVMIYFDKPTQREILKRFAALMGEDGLLFFGHSENFLHANDLISSKGKTVYTLAKK